MKLRSIQPRTWWRIFLCVLGLAIIGWVANIYFAPDGEFTYTYYFNQKPQLISEFTPTGRALAREQNIENGDYYQRIVVDPVYFSVDLPSPYPEAEVTIEYQNPSQNIVQLGLQLDDDESTWNYAFKALENKFVDQSTWSTVENTEYTLLQRQSVYTSVEDFLSNPPTSSHVGTFLTSLELPFIDTSYEPSANTTEISTPLRGRHELYTYIKNEPLQLSVTYHDINYAAGPDPLKINIFHVGTNVFSQEWSDDGDEGISGISQGERTVTINLPDLAEGVYHIVVETNDDILMTNISSAQHKLVFKGRVHLAGSPEYNNTIANIITKPTEVFSTAPFLTMIAKHQYGLGTIEFYDRPVEINKENTVYTWNNPIPNYFHSFSVPQNDVEFITTGLFAFSQDAWFDPLFGFEALSQYSQLSELDYIITGKYTYPERLRSWTTATASFDLTQVNRSDPTRLDFILSAAGLEKAQQGIKVRSIKVTAHKQPVTWATFWPRLKKRLL